MKSLKAPLWLLVGLGVQIVAVILVQAGPVVAYQHYPVASALLEHSRLLLALSAVLILVAWGLWTSRAEIGGWLTGVSRSGWRWAALVGLVVATAAFPSQAPVDYAVELVLASGVQLLGLACFALFALAAHEAWSERVADGFGAAFTDEGSGRGLDRFTVICAAGVAVVAAGLNLLVYEALPHVPDEYAYLIQSRYMARGWMSGATLPVAEAFTPEMMIVATDRMSSIFPPGWPALLALGQIVGAPWLVNPLLAALCVLLVRLLVAETHGAGTARLAVVLLTVSPWFLFLAMSFMSHIASLLFALLGAYAVARARGGAVGFGLLGGGAVGAVSLVRPLEGVMLGLVLGLWVIWPRFDRQWFMRAAAFGVGTLAVGSLNFAYNRAVTGEPLTFPITAWADANFPPGANDLGFGPDRGFGWTGLDPFPGHDVVDVGVNAALNTAAINIELFGWVSGSLLVLFMYLVLGRPARSDLAYLGGAVCVVAVQSLYWFAGGPDFGARYWFLTLIPLVVLSARGLVWLDGRSRPGRVPLLTIALMAGALLVFVPWRSFDKYHGYRGTPAGIERLLAETPFGPDDIVMIRGPLAPDFNEAALLNPIDGSTEGRLFAREVAEDTRARLTAAFPGRRVWVVDGPTLTGGGYRVVEGPTPD